MRAVDSCCWRPFKWFFTSQVCWNANGKKENETKGKKLKRKREPTNSNYKPLNKKLKQQRFFLVGGEKLLGNFRPTWHPLLLLSSFLHSGLCCHRLLSIKAKWVWDLCCVKRQLPLLSTSRRQSKHLRRILYNYSNAFLSTDANDNRHEHGKVKYIQPSLVSRCFP